MAKLFICLSALLVGTLAIPIKDELMFEGPDDTATVESTVREARAAPKHIGDLLKPGNILEYYNKSMFVNIYYIRTYFSFKILVTNI